MPGCVWEDVDRRSHHRRNGGGIRARNGLDWRRLGGSWSSWVGRTPYGTEDMNYFQLELEKV